MKRLLYTIISLFFLVACHQENIEVPPQQPQAEEDKVTLTMSVQIPDAQSAMSRAFNDNGANINKLCLVVFNENNYLSEVAWAYDLGYSPTTEEGNTYTSADDEVCFKVELKPSGNKRYIHFVAYQEDKDDATTTDVVEKDKLTTQLEDIQYGAEATIMSALNVSGTKDAYWQRIELPEIRDNDATKAAMRRVPLVRNFAKITVTNKAEKFVITQIAVVTPPSKGSIAPYFDGDFAVFNDAKTSLPYSTILGTGYYGYSPSDFLSENNQLGPFVAWEENAQSVSTYLYERNQLTNTDKLTYLLIKGKYDNGSDSYYKLDLVDASGDRYNILRNFNYNVTIESVVGDGLSYNDALANAPGNNISGSVEAQNFLNISDGTSQLFVSYVKKTIVSDDAVTLMYKYIPSLTTTDTNGNPVVNNGDVTITPQSKTEENVFASVTTGGIGGYDIVRSSSDETGDNAGWRTITIKPNAPGDNPVTQTLTLKAGNLQRTIIYTLREAYPLIARCETPVNSVMNTPMEVYIYIPTDLPDYIFPLTFFIEADKRSIYPDAANDNMYTSFGPSNNEDRTENTFGFDKELSLSDYDDLETETINGITYKKITCHFLTNIAESASDIYVYNELFNLGECAFTNFTMKEFTTSWTNLDRYGSGRTDGTFSFETEDASEVTVTIKDGDQTIYTNTHSGDTSYTIEDITTASWGNNIVVTLEANGYATETVTITRQKLMMKITGATYTAMFSSKNVSNNSTIYVTYNNESDNFSWNGSNTYEVELKGLKYTDIITFTYTHSGITSCSDKVNVSDLTGTNGVVLDLKR